MDSRLLVACGAAETYADEDCAAMALLRSNSARDGYEPPPFPIAFKAFLSDPRLSFVGHNIESDAARLEEDWGVPLANVREVAPLVSRAFHEEWLRGEFGKKAMVKLEAMAFGVLEGLEVEEEPQVHRSNYYEYEGDLIAFAISDACLAYDIAEKCQERTRRRSAKNRTRFQYFACNQK